MLVSGDAHIDAIHKINPIFLTKELKKRFSSLQIYTALDPYRHSFEKEINYAEEKLEAGAAGFFTQPFFETTLTKRYLDKFKDVEMFVGISPVTDQKNLNIGKL